MESGSSSVFILSNRCTPINHSEFRLPSKSLFHINRSPASFKNKQYIWTDGFCIRARGHEIQSCLHPSPPPCGTFIFDANHACCSQPRACDQTSDVPLQPWAARSLHLGADEDEDDDGCGVQRKKKSGCVSLPFIFQAGEGYIDARD